MRAATVPTRAGTGTRLAAALLGLGLLGACAAIPAERLGTRPAQHQPTPAQRSAEFPLRVYDPWEGWNRGVYKFNAQFDRYVFLPALSAYRYVAPPFVRRRVTDFFGNLAEFRNITGSALQLKAGGAGRGVARLLINSTAGVLGLFDVATPLGIPVQIEDFGQTLGYWGVRPGPYMVVPILGPSSLRDFTGFILDTAAGAYVPVEATVNDRVYFNPGVYFLYALNLRDQTSFRYYGSGSPFEYDYVRFFYVKKRELEISN